MITFVTGDINSGKTTKMMELFKSYGGDGFVSLKIMSGTEVIRFDYLHLSSNKVGPLATKTNLLPFRYMLGPYYFSEEGLTYIDKSMRQSISEGKSPIYLDEIGKLEIEKKGFYQMIIWMLQHMTASDSIYFAVRKVFVNQIIELFNIEDYELIDLGNRRF